MYQPYAPWGAHGSLLLGFSWTRTLVRGGGSVIFECLV
jgi:hypothetical protein